MKMRLLTLTLGLFAFGQTALFSQSTVTRALSSFSEIAISGGYDKVLLKAGDSESVTIEAEGVSPDDVITEIKGKSLNIRMKKGSYHNTKIKVSVNYRSLTAVSNSGSSDIQAENPLKADHFTFNSSGSGDFTGSFDVKKLEINISGSSDMKLSGKAESQAIAISGSGDVDAKGLSGTEASVAISGSGDVSLHVNGPVHTAVSGSGNVHNN